MVWIGIVRHRSLGSNDPSIQVEMAASFACTKPHGTLAETFLNEFILYVVYESISSIYFGFVLCMMMIWYGFGDDN